MADGTRSDEDAALPHQTEAVPCSQSGSFYHPACVAASCLGLEQYPSGKPGVVKIWHSALVFSRTSICILTSSPQLRQAVEDGSCYFGTIDTWLLYKLTKGGYFIMR